MKTKHVFFIAALILTSLLSSIMIVSAESGDVETRLFNDIKNSHENFAAVTFLYNINFVEGYAVTDQTYREYKPDNDINRAEFLALLLRGTQVANYQEYEGCFSDIETGEWYTTYICQAKELGLVNGYPDGGFKPERTINEVEALKILGKISEWELSEPEENEQWYQPYLDKAAEMNIAPEKTVDALMTRGDIAEMIFRLIATAAYDTGVYDDSLIPDIYNTFEIPVEILCKENETCAFAGGDDDSNDDTSDDTDDTGPDASVAEVDINIEMENLITAGSPEEIDIEITAVDEYGSPALGRDLTAIVTTGIDFYEFLPVEELGNGLYKTSFTSTMAAEYTLSVADSITSDSEETTFEIKPDLLQSVEIIDVDEPYENYRPDKAYIYVVGRDKYNNTVPYSGTRNNLSAMTTIGSVTGVTHDNEGIFTIELTADDWGMAEAIIIDDNTGVSFSESVQIPFYPVVLDMPKGISVNDEKINVPVHVFFPGDYGTLASYDFYIFYCTATLEFDGLTDPNPNDSFDIANYEIDADYGMIHISQSISDFDASTTVDNYIADISFNVAAAGDGSIFVTEAVLTNTEEESVGFIDKIAEGIFEWWYGIKDIKDICIHVFLAPGSGATSGNATTDIANANAIYAKNAASCHCDYYLNFQHKKTTTLTAEQWTAIDADSDNILDIDELNTITNNNPAMDNCVPVYYVPKILSDKTAGAAWTNYPSANPINGIAIRNGLVSHHKVLAHELAHHLSRLSVVDPSKPPKSAEQGADTLENLMNYKKTGDNLTEKQCELIEEHVDDFLATP